jgi:hypothetical protein
MQRLVHLRCALCAVSDRVPLAKFSLSAPQGPLVQAHTSAVITKQGASCMKRKQRWERVRAPNLRGLHCRSSTGKLLTHWPGESAELKA